MNEKETAQSPEIVAPSSEVALVRFHLCSASSPAVLEVGARFVAERSTQTSSLERQAVDGAVRNSESCGNPTSMVNGFDCCLWIKKKANTSLVLDTVQKTPRRFKTYTRFENKL